MAQAKIKHNDVLKEEGQGRTLFLLPKVKDRISVPFFASKTV
jgi:hypothetical protein